MGLDQQQSARRNGFKLIGLDLTRVDGVMDGKTVAASSGNQSAIICGSEYVGGKLKAVVPAI
jgi:hypothetical protein